MLGNATQKQLEIREGGTNSRRILLQPDYLFY